MYKKAEPEGTALKKNLEVEITSDRGYTLREPGYPHR